MRPINPRDYEALARARMDSGVWDTYDQGAGDERTRRANEQAFATIWLRPRALVDVTECDTTTTALGAPLAFPAMVAPMSLQALAHPEAEAAMARGVVAAGSLLVASTLSSLPLESIAAAAGPGPLWFQFYLYPDETLNTSLLRRAEQAGYRAIVLTVDAPFIGKRERDLRSGFAPDPALTFGNFAGADGVTWDSRGARLPLTWETITWLRRNTTLPIALKGVLSGEDARQAVEAGVDAIIVSNHGGRQLDGALPAIAALPEVVEAVAGACEVYVDGGVRRGVDILAALALGARGVLVGRPAIWGLAVDGAEGVAGVLRLYHDELTLAMRLAGRRSLAEIDRSLIARAGWAGGAI